MPEKLTIFIAVTSAAVILQMLILLGIYLTLRKLSTHINSLADEVKSQVFPLLEGGKHLLDDIKRILETSSPKVELVLDNAAAVTTTAYAGIGRVEGATNDILDRATAGYPCGRDDNPCPGPSGGYNAKSGTHGDVSNQACERSRARRQRWCECVLREEALA